MEKFKWGVFLAVMALAATMMVHPSWTHAQYTPAGGGGGTSGCVGTAATPCVVTGPVASGSPILNTPLPIGGRDVGGNVRTLLSNLDGSIIVAQTNPANFNAQVVGPQEVGMTIAGNPLAIGVSDGLNVQYPKSTSAANSTSAINSGALLVEKGARWNLPAIPAAGSQATVGKTAGGMGVRHVADCLIFGASAGVAPTPTALAVNIRDGASGSGTLMFTVAAFAPAAVGTIIQPTVLCGLGIVGSANTAMTAEFNAGVANVVESVTLTGYDVQ